MNSLLLTCCCLFIFFYSVNQFNPKLRKATPGGYFPSILKNISAGRFSLHFFPHRQLPFPENNTPYDRLPVHYSPDFYRIAAEQKARTTYDNILRLIHDPEICDPIRFLRQREIVHFQRFVEALTIAQDRLDSKNFYAYNPEFDKPSR